MTLADLAVRLAAARAQASVLTLSNDAVASVDDAYRVQSELAALAHGDVRGWKVTALAAADQKKYASSRPVAGALLAPYVHQAPVTIRLSSLISPLLECEVAFVLRTDLPAQAAPYNTAQIEAAIDAVVPVFELADCRLAAGAPDLMKLADAMGNGAFIVGKPVRDWRGLDLTNIPIALSLDGVDAEHGSSARILGNPLLAVVALANAQPLPAGGLKAGQIVTTGTCTTPIAPRAGKYVGDFGPLGQVEMSIAA